MKKSLILLTLLALIGFSYAMKAEQIVVPIVQNGPTKTVELDDGTIVEVPVSSDDAEQENDAMDALDDDDIDAGWEGEPDDQNILTAGFRFQNIQIPQGAIIESAYIEVVSHEAKTAEDVALINIVGEAADNAETYTLDALITDRPETNAKVLWTVDEEWGLWTTHQTADISSIIQEIVNRPGWQAGNALAIMLKGTDEQGPSDMENAREMEAFENISDPEDGGDGKRHPERVPKLIINFTSDVQTLTIPIVQNGPTKTVELDDGTIVEVPVSSDDAEQENDAMDALDDDDIDAGWEGEPDDQNILTAGFRFQNVTVPPGAVIEEAYIEVVSHEAKTAEDVALINIVGEAADNAETYTLDALITDRPETNAKVLWTVDEEWGLWTTHQTADISSIIQEIVNRPGWQSGNALAIMLKGTDEQGPSDMENAREMEAFENISDPEDGGDGKRHPERVPKLIINFTSDVQTLTIPIVQNGPTKTVELDDGTIVEVPVSSDDAEQENDAMDALDDDDIDAGWEGEPDDQNILTAGFRFQNVTVPPGAVIEEAYIEVVSHEAKTAEDVALINIVGEAADNAETYTLDALITDRPETNAKVLWTVDEEWGLWTTHQTADISSIIQEIVNRPGWQSGNALAIMLKGTDEQGPSDMENAREMEAFENISDPEDGGDGKRHPERVPKLIIRYNQVSSVEETIIGHELLNVYPNPAHGKLNMEFNALGEADIFIYNNTGELVMQERTAPSKTVELDVRHLSTGVYYIKATQNETIYTQKVIID